MILGVESMTTGISKKNNHIKSKCEFSDITKAREDLDADHYAMTDVKKRILEYLAVRQLKNSLRGPILCFVGPPGVGKTSIGKSIANTLGRKFHRYAIILNILKFYYSIITYIWTKLFYSLVKFPIALNFL